MEETYRPGGGAVLFFCGCFDFAYLCEFIWALMNFVMFCRKELLQCGVLNPEKDLYLGKLALSKHPKSPETWIHRLEDLKKNRHELNLS